LVMTSVRGERRRIEDDHIPCRLLLSRGIVEPVEDVRHGETRRSGSHSLRVPTRRRHRILGAVETQDFGRSGTSGMQAESSLIAESIQDPPPRTMARDQGMLLTLVQVEPRLLTMLQIEPDLHPVDREPPRLPRPPGTREDLARQALKTTQRAVVAINDLHGRHHGLQRRFQGGASPLHGQGLDLHDQRVPKLVDHQARKIVRLGPHQPAHRAPVRTQRIATRLRPSQRTDKITFIQGDALPGNPAPHNLRAGIIDSTAQEATGAVAALHDLSVKRRRQDSLNLVDEHPRVPLEHPGTGVRL
jgi:hypothetical protein